MVIIMMVTMVMIMLAVMMMDIQDEGGKIDHQSVVLKELKWPTFPSPALMWRYIGTAITDGEFGVLQSKLNLFQIAPPSPCKPPWGDLWSRGSSQTF